MKFKTTTKQVKWMPGPKYWAGYCELYPLYDHRDAVAYTCGVYGWNYDVYQCGGAVITSGYRGMFGADLPPEAKKILQNARKYCSTAAGHTWDQQAAYLKRARRKFEALL